MDKRVLAIHEVVNAPEVQAKRKPLSLTHVNKLMEFAKANEKATVELLKQAMAETGVTDLSELASVMRVSGRFQALAKGEVTAKPEPAPQVVEAQVVEAQVVEAESAPAPSEENTPPWEGFSLPGDVIETEAVTVSTTPESETESETEVQNPEGPARDAEPAAGPETESETEVQNPEGPARDAEPAGPEAGADTTATVTVSAPAANGKRKRGRDVSGSGDQIQAALTRLVELVEKQEEELKQLREENQQLKANSVKLSSSLVEKLAKYGIGLSA